MKLLELSTIKTLRPGLLLYVLFFGVVVILLVAMRIGLLQAETLLMIVQHRQHSLFTSTNTSMEQMSRSGLSYGYSPGPFPNVSLPCRSRVCSEILTDPGLLDATHYRYCWRKSRLEREPLQSTCRFIHGTGRSPVGLASYHGSGNTWLRGLLQRVTGICTGAVYCDEVLRRRGFPGESIRSGVVLVVKTHQTDPRWTGVEYNKSAPFALFTKLEFVPVYSSAILLIRSPCNAMVSEWHRLMTINSTDNHVNTVGEEYFGEPPCIDIFSYKYRPI